MGLKLITQINSLELLSIRRFIHSQRVGVGVAINSTPHPQPAQLWARTLCQCRSSEQDRILDTDRTLQTSYISLLPPTTTSWWWYFNSVNVIFLTRTPTGTLSPKHTIISSAGSVASVISNTLYDVDFYFRFEASCFPLTVEIITCFTDEETSFF